MEHRGGKVGLVSTFECLSQVQLLLLTSAAPDDHRYGPIQGREVFVNYHLVKQHIPFKIEVNS